MKNLEEMQNLARLIRGRVIAMSHKARTAHLGSSLSCVDIVVAAYGAALHIDPNTPNDPDRDRFLLSKGHAATTLYATLAYLGFFPEQRLDTYAQHGSCLEEHPAPQCVPGVEAATGSLGHGLSLGIGMALAARIQGRRHKVCVVMSDGECEEGSSWEAALFAPAQRLDRLMVVVDFNKWQATGRSCEVMALHPLRQKWEAFGWSAYEVDGHDLAELSARMRNLPDGSGKPVAIIAHTVKGKGVSFMEDDNNWHYRIPSEAEVRAAHQELGLT